MANCAKCGLVIPNSKTNLSGLCEACKWDEITHNPLHNAATAGGVATVLSSRVRTTPHSVESRVHYNPVEQNLAMAIIAGIVAALAAGGLWYVLVTSTDDTSVYASFLVGLVLAEAMYWGNNRNDTWGLQLCSAVMSVIATLGTEYFTYRYLLVNGLGAHGLTLKLPMLMNPDQIHLLFQPGIISGPPWWVAPVLAVAGTVAGRVLRSQRSGA